MPYPTALVGYHVFLISRGETTREFLNSRNFTKADRHRTYNLGVVANFCATLCRPRPPSYVGLKTGYVVGDQRFEKEELEMRMLNPGLPEITDARPITAVSGVGSGGPGSARSAVPSMSHGRLGSRGRDMV